MRTIELEAWARRVVENVAARRSLEDSRVELKAEWPAAAKASRRIAGHCNAARGSEVLWIIGVDESSGPVGVASQDLADWWAQVKAEFNDEAPAMQDLVISIDGVQVVALLFSSDRAPFLVRNPVFGQQGGGAVAWEVPWRDGTSIRTARRTDLLRLLLPRQDIPTVEVLEAEATLETRKSFEWQVRLTIYATLPVGSAVVLPSHQATGSLRWPNATRTIDLEPELAAAKWSPGIGFGQYTASDSRTHTIHQGDAQIILEGPGFFRIHGHASDDVSPVEPLEPLEIVFSLRPAGSDISIPVSCMLSVDSCRKARSLSETCAWRLAEPPPGGIPDGFGQ